MWGRRFDHNYNWTKVITENGKILRVWCGKKWAREMMEEGYTEGQVATIRKMYRQRKMEKGIPGVKKRGWGILGRF